MMAPRMVSKAAEWLARGSVTPRVQGPAGPGVPLPTPEERRAAIAAIEDALAARSRRRGRATFRLAAAACVLLSAGFGAGYAVLGHRSATQPQVASVLAGAGRMEERGETTPLGAGIGVPQGRRLETGPGDVLELAWAGIARVKAEPRSTLALSDVGQRHRLRLERGAVELEVAALPAPWQLVVETDELSIEVRGTAFRVAIDEAGAPCLPAVKTRVEVSRGLVALRRQGALVTTLGAGQSWPRCGTPGAAAGDAPEEGPSAAGDRGNEQRSGAEGQDPLGPRTGGRLTRASSAERERAHGPGRGAAHAGARHHAASRTLAKTGDADSSREISERGAVVASTPASASASASGAPGVSAVAAPAPRVLAPRPTAPAAAPAPAARPTVGDETRTALRESAPRAELPAPVRASSSELGLQNDLFAAALTAKAEGKQGKALAALTELLQRWPHGSLAENARAEKMRLLAQLGRRSAAVAAAREYLSYHPSGFAHAEADALLAAPAP